MGRACRHNRNLLDESHATSDPTLRAVFVEDAVSVSGDVITLAALGLNQIAGSSIPQGVAAVVIGLMLIRGSLRARKAQPRLPARRVAADPIHFREAAGCRSLHPATPAG
jgi:hypothetical protein